MSKITDSILICGSLQTQSLSTESSSVSKATVTQLTSNTTGVTINSNAGIITTVSSTLATGASASFTVTDSSVLSSSLVLSSIVNYTGTGLARVHVSGITTGSFSMTLGNSHPTTAMNAVVKIGFFVV